MESTTEIESRSKAKDIKESAEAIAETAKTTVRDGMEQAREELDRVSVQARHEVRKASEQATTFVKENPGVALAGAIGVGVLIGLSLRQRY